MGMVWDLPKINQFLSEEQLKISVCGFCMTNHRGLCPLIESVEFYRNGKIKKIIFKSD